MGLGYVVAESGDADYKAIAKEKAECLGDGLSCQTVLLCEGGDRRCRIARHQGAGLDLLTQNRGEPNIGPRIFHPPCLPARRRLSSGSVVHARQ